MIARRKLDWATMLGELAAFQVRYGHIRIDSRYPILAKWLRGVQGRLATLTYDQILDLDNQGFFRKWDRRWLDRYAQLRNFKGALGHCNVPVRWPRNQSLAGWVQTQRHDASNMIPWRRKLLTDLGFCFRLRYRGVGSSTDWDEVIKRLTRYRKRFGHCNVPARWSEDQTLAAWVYRLRSIKKRLDPKIIKRLDAMRFDWNPFRTAWEKRFRDLESFKEAMGHCHVPIRWPENPPLATWVQTQRANSANLAPSRRKRLTALGFCFRVRYRRARSVARGAP